MPARAADATRSFDVPAGEASETLKRFAEQAGQQVVYPANEVRGVRTAEVKGQLTVREALARLLKGTDLRGDFDERSGTFAVSKSTAASAKKDPARVDSSAVSRAATSPADAAKDDVLQLARYDVSAYQDVGYSALTSVSATKLNMPLMDIPVNINVMTREFLEDLGDGDVRQVLRYNASSSNANNVSLRGFSATTRSIDGFLVEGRVPSASQSLERVEILKGPSGVLYGGAGNPGGMIMYVRKKPVARTAFVHFNAGFGYVEGQPRTTAGIDMNSSVGVFDFRFVGNYSERESAQPHAALEHGSSRRKNIYPSLAFNLTPTTRVTVGYNFYEEHVRSQIGDSASGIRFGTLPLSVKYGLDDYYDMGWGKRVTNQTTDTYVLIDQKLPGDIAIRGGWNWFVGRTSSPSGISNTPLELTVVNAAGTPILDAAGRPTVKPVIRQDFSQSTRFPEIHDFQLNASKAFDMFGGKQHLLFAFQHQEYERSQDAKRALTRNGQRAPNVVQGPGYLVRDPSPQDRQYRYVFFLDEAWPRGLPTDLNWITTTPYSEVGEVYTSYTLNWVGQFMENRFNVMAGASFTDWENSRINLSADKWNPQLGAIYKVTPAVGVFANYAQSMRSTTKTDGFDRGFSPEYASGIEAGVKVDLLGGLAQGTIAAYETVDKDIVIEDPLAPNRNWLESGATDATRNPNLLGANRAAGEVTAKGVEADLLFTLGQRRNYQMKFSYAYADAKTTADTNRANVGQPLSAHAFNSMAAWNKYTFVDGRLKGWFVGGGAVWRDKQYTGATTPRSPERLQFDALVGFERRFQRFAFRATLNVRNLTEEETRVFNGTVNPATGGPFEFEEPRHTWLDLSFRF